MESGKHNVHPRTSFGIGIATQPLHCSRSGAHNSAQRRIIHRAHHLLFLPSLRRNRSARCPRTMHNPSSRYHHEGQDSHPRLGVYPCTTAGRQHIHKGNVLEQLYRAGERNVQYSAKGGASGDGHQFRQS